MTDGRVTYEVDGHVAVVTLDRPARHNSMTLAMTRELADATAEARRDEVVRAVVLTGAGEKAFSAGGDLAELIPRLSAGHTSMCCSRIPPGGSSATSTSRSSPQ